VEAGVELSVERLSVTLGRRTVLDAIDARLRPGRVTAILGPNGAGKSTLLKAAAGLVPAAAGTVRLGGAAVATMAPRARARAIGYLPQDAAVHWNVPAREVVALGRLAHRAPFAAPDAEDAGAIADAVAATEIAALLDRPVATLSGGERARVLLARVLAGTPRWLLADEPLASLDPAHQFDVLDRLREVAARGSGVAIVLHDIAHAARIADDVLLLKAGRLVAAGPVAETLTPAAVAALFGVAVRWCDGVLVPIGRSPG